MTWVTFEATPCRSGYTIDATCSCGARETINSKRRKPMSERCRKCRAARMRAPMPIGSTWGKWTTLSEPFGVKGSTRVKAICECGKLHSPLVHNIRSGRSRSCGCLLTAYRVGSRITAPTKVSIRVLAALEVLLDDGTLPTLVALADATEVSRSSVGDSIRLLERFELIETKPVDVEGRLRRPTKITAKGQALLDGKAA